MPDTIIDGASFPGNSRASSVPRRSILMGGLGALLMPSVVSGEETPPYGLEYQAVRRSQVEVTHFIECEDVDASEWVLYAACAPAVEWEKDVATQVDLITAADQVIPFVRTAELGPQRRPVWKLKLDAAKTGTGKGVFAWKQSIAATVSSVRLVRGGGASLPPLPEAERKSYLRDTATYDFNHPEVQKWLDRGRLRRTAGESALDFGFRVYTRLVKRMPYDTKDGGAWVASRICKVGFGECARHSIVATSALRANGVPARTVCALWAKDTAQGEGGNGHVWCEFFADGVGWVPLDSSRAVAHSRPDDFFGYQPGELVAGMIDFDYLLDSEWHGMKTVFAIDAFAGIWMKGRGRVHYPPKMSYSTQVRHIGT